MVFVTGGTGLLGTHLLLELLARGEKVRALKRSNSDLSHTKSIFNFYLQEKAPSTFEKIEWVDGDILDIVSLEDHIRGCDKVYHCAAVVSFLKKDFKKMWLANKIGTKNVVNICLSSGVKQLSYISSTATIGKPTGVDMLTEEQKWVNDSDNSNYAITKFSAELEVWRGIEEGLDAVIVNPSIILGPGNWNESSVSIFKVIKNGLKFYTPGKNAFVDARDVATIVVELSEKNICNERFLVISENLTFKSLFEKIASKFSVKPPSILAKQWMIAIAWRIEGFLRVLFGRKQNISKETAKSGMSNYSYSNQKIIEKLNFQFISIDSSIQNAVNYFNTVKN